MSPDSKEPGDKAGRRLDGQKTRRVAPTLSGFDFRNSALVQSKVRRDVMLTVAFRETTHDFTDSVGSHRGAKAPFSLICHDVLL